MGAHLTLCQDNPMQDYNRAVVSELIQNGRFEEAEDILDSAITTAPTDGDLWHLKGQCLRFQENYKEAIACHQKAADMLPDIAPVLLALGVSQQLNGDLDAARQTLISAHNLDSDNSAVLNSLGMTFKLLGRLEEADQAYVGGLRAHARSIVGSFENSRESPLAEFEDIAHNLWAEYALYGATFLATNIQGISSLALPDSEFAIKEACSKEHGGLFWKVVESDNGRALFLLPNFLDSFRDRLYGDVVYSNLLGNRGTVLRMSGDVEGSKQHISEATFFQQRRA